MRNYTAEIRSALDSAEVSTSTHPSLLEELVALTAAAEEKEGILYSLTPQYRHKYVDAVAAHVHRLGQDARRYNRYTRCGIIYQNIDTQF